MKILYIINSQFSGAPTPFRRFISAPKVQFETTTEKPITVHSNKLPSADPDDYIFDDLASTRYPLPGAAVATTDLDGPEFSVNIGGAVRDNSTNKLKSVRIAQPTIPIEDPFTAEPATALVKSANPFKGETVYIIIETLNQEGHN